MRIVICGGHLTPALSVIEALSKEDAIFYFGRKYAIEGDRATSLEFETIVKKGIPFIDIRTGRLQRSFTRHTLPSFLRIPAGFVQSLVELMKAKPDVVVGFGSYVSIPVCMAAKVLRIPVIIHEQTLEIGAANKVLSRFADKICISFETSAKFFPQDKVVLTGNPIRRAILNPANSFEHSLTPPIIYITGGSLGSHAINLLVSQSLNRLLQKYSIIHQTGSAEEFRDFDKLSILREGLNNNIRDRYVLSKYYSPEEVGEVFKASQLVICRAGINTVSELIVLRKPALLIPLPVSQKNEQMKNALFIKKLGLGEVAEQNSLTPDSFVALIDKMIKKLDNYTLGEPSKYFPKDSAKKIVRQIYASAQNYH